MDGVPGARWQDDDQLHLTVRFIGTVDRPMAEDIAAALGTINAPLATIAIAGVGRFEQRGRTDTLWAAVAPSDILAALHRKVDRALVRVGLAPEHRAYRPHITLARLPRSMGNGPDLDHWIATHAALASVPFTLDHLFLYESHLTNDGARYELVVCWPLDPRA